MSLFARFALTPFVVFPAVVAAWAGRLLRGGGDAFAREFTRAELVLIVAALVIAVAGIGPIIRCLTQSAASPRQGARAALAAVLAAASGLSIIYIVSQSAGPSCCEPVPDPS